MQSYNSYYNTADIGEGSSVSLLGAILKRWFIIFLVTILCASAGFLYATMMVKPTYTVSRSVLLRLSVGNISANTVTTDTTLSKIYLPDVLELVKSPDVIKKAGEVYGKANSVNAGSVSVNGSKENRDSLIFSISYTDADAKVAEGKLNSIIDSVMIVDNDKGLIVAESFVLIPTQNDVSVSINNNSFKYIVIGFLAGLILSVGVIIIIFMTDNTIKNKFEFEEITGVDVLSSIRKIK